MWKLVLISLCLGATLCVTEAMLMSDCHGPIVHCFVEPCLFAKCPNHPQAICHNDYCGRCNAVWMEAGKDVTTDCGSPSS